MQYDQFDPATMKPSELKIQFATIRTELKHKEEDLKQIKQQLDALQNQPKKKAPVWKMVLAFSISILFGITSIMFNIGTSMATAKPPDPFGNTLLALAGIIFVICTLVSTFIIGGSTI